LGVVSISWTDDSMWVRRLLSLLVLVLVMFTSVSMPVITMMGTTDGVANITTR